MTFGVTPTGFKAKRYSDILAELGDSFKNELGIDIDSNPDSIAKVLTNIMSLSLAEQWALPQAVQSMLDINKSEGAHLENLVGYVGLTRLEEAFSNGFCFIKANKEMTIPKGNTFRDINNHTYLNVDEIPVTTSSCVVLTLELLPSVAVNDIVTVVIGGESFHKTVSSTWTVALSTLATDIINRVNGVFTVTSDHDSITITSVNDRESANIAHSNNFKVREVTSIGNISKTEVGDFGVPANIVTGAPSLEGIIEVNNRYIFTVGRYRETDEALRLRHKASVRTSGAATVEAIRADLLGISGVTSAIIIENDTMVDVVDGTEAKAFSVVVKGGADQDIGEVLWKTKGAGIPTNGNIPVTIVDSQGTSQVMKFSRPNPIYVHIHVEYEKYSEEFGVFPTDGEDQMRDKIVAYGSSLDVGVDVIPQRFSSNIFNSIGGLSQVNITAGTTLAPNEPTPALTMNVLPVNTLSESEFDALRVTFTEI
jgi:hypothetical protein